jgi:hypothetical protein
MGPRCWGAQVEGVPTPNAVACCILVCPSTAGKILATRLLALIVLIGYLTYLVISPFLAPLAWATVFAVMFARVHSQLSARIGASMSPSCDQLVPRRCQPMGPPLRPTQGANRRVGSRVLLVIGPAASTQCMVRSDSDTA